MPGRANLISAFTNASEAKSVSCRNRVSIEYSGVCSSIQASCVGHLDKRKWRLELFAAACSAAVVTHCKCTPDNAGMCMLQLAAHQVIGVQAPAHLLSSCMTLHAHAHAGWLNANPADGRCSSQCVLCSEAATKRCMRVTLYGISQHAATPNAVLSPHRCHLALASSWWQGENPHAHREAAAATRLPTWATSWKT